MFTMRRLQSQLWKLKRHGQNLPGGVHRLRAVNAGVLRSSLLLPSMDTPRDTLAVALDARAKGIVAIPCYPNTKVPMVKWKEWQQKMPAEELIRQWFRVACNIAILTTDMVVFDCDDPDEAKRVIAECGETCHKLKTPRGGVHLGYRRRKGVVVVNAVKVRGRAIDIRTDGGMEMIPPSRIENGTDEWLGEGLRPLSELPVAKVGWTRERIGRRTKTVLTRAEDLPAARGSIRCPEAYCLKIDSIQGQNGSRALVRVVCVLRDAGRTPQQIFDFIKRVWGPACARPEWSEGEIRHCIERHCPKG